MTNAGGAWEKSDKKVDLRHKKSHSSAPQMLTFCNSMTLYQHMLIFYAVVALVAAVITFFIAKDRMRIKLLSAALVGATWPMSFPVALLVALF